MDAFSIGRTVGFESRKSYAWRVQNGFWSRYAAAAPGTPATALPKVLDIGFRGGIGHALPICEGAVGIELDTPGYDGLKLPVLSGSQDAVHASHVLEHVPDAIASLREWFRVLRPGGCLLIFVPHAFLYERKLPAAVPPSNWSGEHLRGYSPKTLLADVEHALEPNTYRIRHLADCDCGYAYDLPPDQHPQGCLEIELVVQRITPPTWKLG